MTAWPARLPVVGTLGKFTWRMLATVLGSQSILIFFGALVARGNAIAAGDAEGGRLLTVGSLLAVAAIVAAGLMRTSLGLPLGWLVQIATWASALVVPAMIGVGLVFTGLWVYCLIKGPRIDAMMAARAQEATAADSSGETTASGAPGSADAASAERAG